MTTPPDDIIELTPEQRAYEVELMIADGWSRESAEEAIAMAVGETAGDLVVDESA